MPTYAEVVAQLTGPGAPFEIVTETVAGRPMKNWKNRERSMREKVANARPARRRRFHGATASGASATPSSRTRVGHGRIAAR